MFKQVINAFSLLSYRQKKHYMYVLISRMVASIAELVGVGTIVPLISMLANPDLIFENAMMFFLAQSFGTPSVETFVIYFTGMVVGALVLSNIMILISLFVTHRYIHRLSGEISSNLYKYFLHKDYLEIKTNHSSLLITKIINFGPQFCEGIIHSSINFISRCFLVLIISLLLLIYQPIITLTVFSLILGFYIVVYWFVKKTIFRLGNQIAEDRILLNKHLVESFSAAKTVRLYGLEPRFSGAFFKCQKRLARSGSNVSILGASPFYIMEIVAVVSIVVLSVYLFLMSNRFQDYVGLLTLFGIGAYRLMPACQRAYHDLGKISKAIPVYEKIKEELTKSNCLRLPISTEEIPTINFDYSKGIEIENIRFSYDKTNTVFDGFSCHIPLSGIVTIQGASGNGKSTLLELITGLLRCDDGNIKVGGVRLSDHNIRHWQDSISYVPQDVYLFDDSLQYNILLGEKLDENRFKRAITLSGLQTMSTSLPQGLETKIGENASFLSGGQRQRIGIARGIYRSADVLILDESMNALDLLSAQKIMKNIFLEMEYKAIIIVTHRKEEFTEEYDSVKLEIS